MNLKLRNSYYYKVLEVFETETSKGKTIRLKLEDSDVENGWCYVHMPRNVRTEMFAMIEKLKITIAYQLYITNLIVQHQIVKEAHQTLVKNGGRRQKLGKRNIAKHLLQLQEQEIG
ncbi:Aminopeptidase Q [Frankliniella fusca]|uniref:Aminopeptidase Q n=1 Tax=Frankliniella fusca TaxID=407009 RepID=A0AAE1GY95_9NEOP|nr:Aminopeptidase Q [Frankliniella fusca]